MIQVTLSYPSHARRDVVLLAIPDIGHNIRLADADPSDPSLIVEYVLHVEGTNGSGHAPSVIVCVREAPGGPTA
jgi:hypothetical protein